MSQYHFFCKDLSRFGMGIDVQRCPHCKGVLSFRNGSSFCRACDKYIHNILIMENNKRGNRFRRSAKNAERKTAAANGVWADAA